MKNKRFLIASLTFFLFIFMYEFAFHSVYLKEIYESTQHLWRPKAECVYWAMISAQLIFPFVFTTIFLKGFKNTGIGEGVRYGMLIGMLLIPGHLVMYAVQDIPFGLVLAWSIGGLFEMMLGGGLVAGILKK